MVGATNRPDVLDPALLRPGRFDRTVGLERPDEDDRLEILALHAETRRLEPGADLGSIAARAHGMTGADLANVINEAALLAARAERPAISQAELEQGLTRVLEAPERQRRISMRDRSVGRRASAGEERASFSDLVGVEEAIDELSEVRDYLKEPERFAAVGARPPRGLLLSGPPGCGKTLLARAVAGEANAAFYSAAATEFVEVFVGEGASRVRDLLAEAKAVAPAIIFLDEIDALGAHRAQVALDGHREREQTLNQLLVELDGFEACTGVIVMAATNRPDMLDPALVRPGRFDRQVEITLPDRQGRRAILSLHARGKRLGEDADLDTVAGVTQGFSGADLAGVVNEAALLSARRGAPEISRAMLEEAVERVLLGVASRRHVMGEAERRIVAYHEAGHLAGTWRTWVRSGRELRPPPPPAFDSPQFREEAAEVVRASRQLTPEQRRIAKFWEGGEGRRCRPGSGNRVTFAYLREARLSVPYSTRVIALLKVALADAGVAAWDAKYIYWVPRPENAVRDLGIDPRWKPYLDTPFFPAYVSGHATYSGGAGEILAHLFPEDAGVFRAKAREAAMSRVYGGIHYMMDGEVGMRMGRRIGHLVVKRARRDGAEARLRP